MQVPLNFYPRDYQCEALAALDLGTVMNIWCWARRGGKDFTAFGYAVKKMVEQPMNVALVFPTKEQGMRSFWNNVENDGFKTIEHIPKSLIARQDNSNMRITLKNGSVFEVLGATDPDALRGANAKLYIFSEFVDIDSAALEVIRPIIAVNGGQIIIQSTPKIDGISGGTFKILFDRALKNWTKGPKSQFASLITAREYLSEDVLQELRQEIIAKYGNDFYWRQEYLCDWGQASSSSYYGSVIQLLKKKNLMGAHEYNAAFPAYTSWDLGRGSGTSAITFFQYYNKVPRIIDYYETQDIGDGPVVKFVQSKQYNLAWHFLPHDGSTSDSDAIQRIEKFREHGLINSSLLKREPVEDGIKRTVEKLAITEVNEGTTEDLFRKLILYKRKFNPHTGDYLGPEHKTESHGADSVRYMFAAIDQDFDPVTGAFLYGDDMVQEYYEADTVNTPSLWRG